MILIVTFAILTLVQGLHPKDEGKDEIKHIISKYIDKISDPEPKYVMNEGISKMISNYYRGKIDTFPLYRITLKVDREPVEIPWTLGATVNEDMTQGKKYKYVKVRKPDQ